MATSMIQPDKPLGEYIAIYLARAADPNIRVKRVGSGGAVTALLLYMLEHGVVDGVVVAKKIKGFTGEIVIAKTREELLEAAGDRWGVLPFTMKLKEKLLEEDIKKVAIVGLPCQAQFLWQMKMFPMLETDFSNKIKLVVSLFCLGTFATEAFLSYLKTIHGIDPDTIETIRIIGDKIIVVHGGVEKEMHIRDVLPYMQLGCLVCNDYTGVFSDISAGTSETYPGYTVLITRTSEADKILNEASKEKYVELQKAPLSIIEEIEMKAKAKIMRALKYMSIVL
ncbi:Coenzyme F420 hydrogenase/dehydrogenase, beta subunit C-terminal domain [Desulfurococcaceae archaeon MEX13E-LK6-19]|nr:Coenzyme F420 hydrogenase/dehydrogenase, beta subunit C-terminal domain [Desulfurococcaceae archaeon MEX13E-LK6-19]